MHGPQPITATTAWLTSGKNDKRFEIGATPVVRGQCHLPRPFAAAPSILSTELRIPPPNWIDRAETGEAVMPLRNPKPWSASSSFSMCSDRGLASFRMSENHLGYCDFGISEIIQ